VKRREFLSGLAAIASVLEVRQSGAATVPCPPGRLSVAGGTPVSTACDSALGVISPAWASGLSDFSVRSMTGTAFGPVNGKETLLDVLPEGWRDPFSVSGGGQGASQIISAWSGGKGDSESGRLFVQGGGHGDSANNGIYVFSFGTGDRPIGWSLAGAPYPSDECSLSNSSSVISSQTTYLDGKPTSVHTYDQTWFDSARNRLYRIGGGAYKSGSSCTAGYFWDFNANRGWAKYVDGLSPGGVYYAGSLIGSQDGQLQFFLCYGASFFIDCSTGERTAVAQLGIPSATVEPVSAFDSKNQRWISMASYGSVPWVYTYSIDWSKKALNSVVDRSSSGSLPEFFKTNKSSGSLVYDQKLHRFWYFGFKSATQMPGLMSAVVLEIDPDTFSIVQHELTAEPGSSLPSVNKGSQGSFNRHVWFPKYRVFATVQSYNSAVSVVKLPG